MESVHQDYENFTEHSSSSQSIPPSSPDINDIVGAPQLNPRLGHEYQVEIPSMIKESERLQLLMNPADSEVELDNSHSFVMGLSIPLIWIHNEEDESGHEGWEYLGVNDGTVKAIEPAATANVEKNSISGNGNELRPTTLQSVMTGDSKSVQLDKSKSYLIAPGTLSSSWNDADVKSFVLGLFIFGKNFIQIKRFLDNKGMGEILSFYYGRFYRSDEYRRWSGCKKIKGKKCMTGQKLFTGWRQHELLSRLIPHVSEEFQDTLKQVSKSYGEGSVSLEEYVSSLKSAVGLGVLVEVVGIGKGKEDLTSLAVDPGKNNRVVSIPTNKNWSSLGPSDIIKFLTGGFRLSKAKSNDLFWEAVWPRLLARGWHSEQPKNQGYVSNKDFLVFLIPGVKKFSRRKLVKGDHYFDSVSDVLSKVVAEPNLLELGVEEAKVGSYNDEKPEKGSNEDDQSDYHRHCYLKPRASTYNTDHMKFTVIDTSLVHGGKSSELRELKSLPGNSVGKIEVDAASITNKGDKHISKANCNKGMFDSINQKLTMFTVVDTSLLYKGKLSKVRELRYAPVELEDTSKLTVFARESEGSSSNDDPPSKTEAAMLIYGKKNISNADCQKATSNRASTNQKEANDNQDNNANKMVESCQNQKTCVSDGNQLKRAIKHQFSRRVRSGHLNHAVPPIKRRRLTACAKAETSRILENSSGGLGSEKLGPSQSLSLPDANKNASDPVSHQQNASLIASSAESSVEEIKEGSILNKICLDKGISCGKVEKCESQPPINFNALHVPPPKSEKDEMMAMMEEDGQCLKPNDPCLKSDTQEVVEKPLRTSCDVGSMEQQPDMLPRRQSTRNRPLTVRALESLATEFLHVQRRQKRKDIQTIKDAFSPYRRARTRVKTMLHHHSSGHGTAVSMEERHLNGDCGDCSVNENISKPLHCSVKTTDSSPV